MSGPRIRHVPRARDEEVLQWLDRRVRGESCAAIGAAFGVAERAVEAATRAVRAADLAESGEDAARVRRGYW